MAIKKIVEIEVKDKDLIALEKQLKDVGIEFENVEDKSKKTTQEISSGSKKGKVDLSALDDVTGGMASKFEQARDGVKSFNIGLKGVKGALLASGIGILVVILGEVIAHWDEIIGYIDGSTERLKEQKRVLDEINIATKENARIRSQAEAGIKQAVESQKLEAELAGKSKAELFEIEKRGLEAVLALRQQKAEEAKQNFITARDNDSEDLDKFRDAQLDAVSAFETAKADIAIATLQERLRLQRELEANANPKDREKATGVEGLEETGDFEDSARYEKLVADFEAETELKAIFMGNELDLLQAHEGLKNQVLFDAANARMREEERIEAGRIAIKERGKNAVIALANEETAVGRAALVFKQINAAKELLIDLGLIRSKATKTLAEASLDGTKSGSSIATGLAATLSLGFPAAIPALIGYAASAVGIVAGVISAVKGTKKVASKYGATGGGSDVSIAPPQAQVADIPEFNIVEQNQTNQLADAVLNQKNQPIEAYVVDKNITSSQELTRNKVETSSLGN